MLARERRSDGLDEAISQQGDEAGSSEVRGDAGADRAPHVLTAFVVRNGSLHRDSHSKPGQLPEIRVILRRLFRVIASRRLTTHEGCKPNEMRAHSVQFTDVVRERLLRPRSPSVAQGREDASVAVADEIRELEPDRSALVAGASVFVIERCMTPAVVLKESAISGRSTSPSMSKSSCARVTEPA
jgi:hypothetical protein